jgi:hypothetical protein
MSRTNDLADCVVAVESQGIGVRFWNSLFIGAAGVPLVRLAENQEGALFQGNGYAGEHSLVARVGVCVVKSLDAWRTLGQERHGTQPVGHWVKTPLNLGAPRAPVGEFDRLASLNAFGPRPDSIEAKAGLDLPAFFGVDAGGRDWSGRRLADRFPRPLGALTVARISRDE